MIDKKRKRQQLFGNREDTCRVYTKRQLWDRMIRKSLAELATLIFVVFLISLL